MKRLILALLVCIGPVGIFASEKETAMCPEAVLGDEQEVEDLKPNLVLNALRSVVMNLRELPENRADLLEALARNLSINKFLLMAQFGDGHAFRDLEDVIQQARNKFAPLFAKTIDRSVFSQAREDRMKDAIRNADSLLLFKLGENQPLFEIESVLALAEELNAPVVIAPSFSVIGTVPEALGDLLNHPRVHVFTGQEMYFTKDFVIVNNGANEKIENPFVGLDQVYGPTTRVLQFHPKSIFSTRPSGSNASNPAFSMSTGSMTAPIFSSRGSSGMPTDLRATLAGEKNLGLTILSRGYQNPKFSRIGGAQGAVPRHARWTEAKYGNPAGLFDLGKIYHEKGVTRPSWIPGAVLGDIHLGATDPMYMKAVIDFFVSLDILRWKPAASSLGSPTLVPGSVNLGAIVLHDLIDGTPNNHHIFDKLQTRSKLDQKDLMDLEMHIKSAAAFVQSILTLLPQTTVVVPVDNHGFDWLVSSLQTGDFFKTNSPRDYPLLARLMAEGMTTAHHNPYERLFQISGIDTDRVRFMGPTDNYKIGVDPANPNRMGVLSGVEVGQHSHMGVNGSKSISIKALLAAYGPIIGGHTHSTARLGNAGRVGTGTHTQQSYHRGPSGSNQSIALAYGEVFQTLLLDHGTFFPNAPGRPPEHFFPNETFPLIRDRPAGGAGSGRMGVQQPVYRPRR
ncbi:MAG: hypothetical protein K2X47_08525 [Bdellovibrionales bacterium]|nr:hypothetical protein [Bdellovibrionales bacterium]